MGEESLNELKVEGPVNKAFIKGLRARFPSNSNILFIAGECLQYLEKNVVYSGGQRISNIAHIEGIPDLDERLRIIRLTPNHQRRDELMNKAIPGGIGIGLRPKGYDQSKGSRRVNAEYPSATDSIGEVRRAESVNVGAMGWQANDVSKYRRVLVNVCKLTTEVAPDGGLGIGHLRSQTSASAQYAILEKASKQANLAARERAGANEKPRKDDIGWASFERVENILDPDRHDRFRQSAESTSAPESMVLYV
jgi:hypothetical protein